MEKSTKMTIGGIIMGVIGAIISIEFLAVDAILFNYQPPEWIATLSGLLPLSGLDLDILMTIDLILIIMEFKWQGEDD